MKISEAVRAEIENALGKQIPEPGDRDFAAFYSYLELNHPKLAVRLSQGIEDDPVAKLFPDQLAQARTREQARGWMQRFFYRQDEQTGAPVLAKGKVGAAVMLGLALIFSPFLFSGANFGSKTRPEQKAEPVVAAAPKPKEAIPEVVPPVTEDTASVPKPTAPAPEEIPTAPTQPLEPLPQQAPAYVAPSYTPPQAAPVIVKAPRQAGGQLYRRTQPSRSGTVMYRRTRAVASAALPQASGSLPRSEMAPFDPSAEGADLTDAKSAADGANNMMFSKNAPQVPGGAAAPSVSRADLQPGSTLRASLVVGVLLADGLTTVPVVARGENGAVFIGLATMNPARRVSMSFSEVSYGGQSQRIQAQAVGSDGALGVPTVLEDMAPDLLGDTLRGTAQGVADYVQGLREATTTTLIPGVGATESRTAPPLGTSIAGALANMFTPPQQNQKALIRVARVAQDSELSIVVLSLNQQN